MLGGVMLRCVMPTLHYGPSPAQLFDHTQELAFDTADEPEKQQNVVLCDVARVVARELRCFYSDLYASQVEAAPEATRNTTEFFRDKWADGRNTVRAIANASRMVGSSKKLGA